MLSDIFSKIISLLLSAVLSLFAGFQGCLPKEDDDSLIPEDLSEYVVPEWYRDAKFGIFIHYGVYSVPAYGDEWYGHQMYIPDSRTYGGDIIYDYHLATYGGADKFGYKDFIPEFAENLKKFKENNMAEKWAELFEKAGAKYVMPVGIHHDSFALYSSDVQTTYNSVSQSGVDYIAELKQACEKRDLKFGISNHFVENDWFFDDAYAEGTDLAEKNDDGSLVYGELYGDGLSKSYAHIHKWYDISMEIINKYHPDMIYYDFDLCNGELNRYADANRYLMLSEYYEQALANNPDGVVCCNKNEAFTQAQALLEKERSSLAEIAVTPWQTDTSVGQKSWGYVTNEIYRDGKQFIGALVDIVSKNGNLLLNIGPKADGTIPEEAADALLTIGSWLSKYGDAVYCTRPWLVSGEGTSQNTGDSFTYNEGDIRFTKSKDSSKLYVTSLTSLSCDTLRVKTLANGDWNAQTIDKISLINADERTELNWLQTEDALKIILPENLENEPFSVEITFVDNKIPAIATDCQKQTKPENAYEALSVTVGHSTADGSNTVISQADGAYIKHKLSFEDITAGMMCVEVSGESEGTISVYNDDTGKLITSFDIKADGKDFRTVSAKLSEGCVAEKSNIRIELSKGIELSSFSFKEKRELNRIIDASKFDEKSGSVRAEGTSDAQGGNSLGYVAKGDWVLYRNVDFSKGCKKLILRAGADSKSYKVYIDSMKKTNIIASGKIATGSYDNYETIVTDISKLKNVSGVHDVYIEFADDAINLNWFCFADNTFSYSE